MGKWSRDGGRIGVVGLCLMALMFPLGAHAQTMAQIVARGKAATALLEVPAASGKAEDEVSGTAFCVDASGFFVTNAHVTSEAASETLTLRLHSGERGEKAYKAHVVRTDADADLSLLKVDGAARLATLPLGHDEKLIETTPVTAFGYPFGKDLALDDKAEPNITVSTGHITALRRSKGELEFIQLDASLNPGNSGGPVLDAQGRVVGVVEAGVPGASLNFAIPVHTLAAFLARPDIVFDTLPPPLPHKPNDPRTFHIGVTVLLPTAGPLTVALELRAPGEAARVFPAKQVSPHAYEVTATPVAPRTRLTGAATPSVVNYRISVKDGGREIGQKVGTLYLPGGAHRGGLLVVAADAWPTSDTGFAQAPPGATARFVRNIARFLCGPTGRILIYSTHWAFKEPFQQTLRKAGYTVTASMTPGPLTQYDAVFVGGDGGMDRAALRTYLDRGGRVYLLAGTGDIRPDERAFWNTFLIGFGLHLEPGPPINDRETVTTFTDSPLFEGVSGLLLRGAFNITARPGWPGTQIVCTWKNAGLWAVAPAAVPYHTPPAGTALTPAQEVMFAPIRDGARLMDRDSGHWYEAVSVPGGLSWYAAKARAAAMACHGLRGHLATLTTATEALWVADHFPEAVAGPYWLGGFQSHSAPGYHEPDGGWGWVTGEPWSFTRWNHGLYQEPNDAYDGHEDFLTFAAGGAWNDMREDGRTPGYVVPGFMVEYE